MQLLDEVRENTDEPILRNYVEIGFRRLSGLRGLAEIGLLCNIMSQHCFMVVFIQISFGSSEVGKLSSRDVTQGRSLIKGFPYIMKHII